MHPTHPGVNTACVFEKSFPNRVGASSTLTTEALCQVSQEVVALRSVHCAPPSYLKCQESGWSHQCTLTTLRLWDVELLLSLLVVWNGPHPEVKQRLQYQPLSTSIDIEIPFNLMSTVSGLFDRLLFTRYRVYSFSSHLERAISTRWASSVFLEFSASCNRLLPNGLPFCSSGTHNLWNDTLWGHVHHHICDTEALCEQYGFPSVVSVVFP